MNEAARHRAAVPSVARRLVDGLYEICGLLAGVCLVLIAVLVVAQIGGRLLGILVPSADDFAGFAMAASIFLALAHTLRAGGHIRVALVLDRLQPARRRAAELLCTAAGAAVIVYFSWYVFDMAWDSYRFGDLSLGMVPTPLWIPQSALGFGLAVLAIAFADEFIHLARGGAPRYEGRDAA